MGMPARWKWLVAAHPEHGYVQQHADGNGDTSGPEAKRVAWRWRTEMLRASCCAPLVHYVVTTDRSMPETKGVEAERRSQAATGVHQYHGRRQQAQASEGRCISPSLDGICRSSPQFSSQRRALSIRESRLRHAALPASPKAVDARRRRRWRHREEHAMPRNENDPLKTRSPQPPEGRR